MSLRRAAATRQSTRITHRLLRCARNDILYNNAQLTLQKQPSILHTYEKTTAHKWRAYLSHKKRYYPARTCWCDRCHPPDNYCDRKRKLYAIGNTGPQYGTLFQDKRWKIIFLWIVNSVQSLPAPMRKRYGVRTLRRTGRWLNPCNQCLYESKYKRNNHDHTATHHTRTCHKSWPYLDAWYDYYVTVCVPTRCICTLCNLCISCTRARRTRTHAQAHGWTHRISHWRRHAFYFDTLSVISSWIWSVALSNSWCYDTYKTYRYYLGRKKELNMSCWTCFSIYLKVNACILK